MNQTTVAKYLIQRLKENGINYMFVSPGNNLGPFFTEVMKDKSITIVTATSEQEASFAADSHAKMTKIPACVSINFGSGSLQVINSVSGSFVEQNPIIVINGAPSLKKYYQARDQGFISSNGILDGKWSQVEQFRKCTVQAERIESSVMAPQQIDQAFTACMSFNRPVYIEVPEDVFGANCQAPQSRVLPRHQTSDQNQLEKTVQQIVNRINNAKNPVIYAGIEIQRNGIADVFQQFIEKSKIGYATSLTAKGIISEQNNNFVGIWAGKNSSKQTQESFKNADLIFMVGVAVTEIEALGISNEDFNNFGKKIIMIAAQNSFKDDNFYTSQVTVKDIMIQLIRRVEQSQLNVNKNSIQKFSPLQVQYQGNDQLTYDSSVYQISKSNMFASSNSVIIADTSFSILPLSNVQVQKDQFISQVSWNQKGYSLSAAIGVHTASNNKRPIVFIGDGGFQHSSNSIGTLSKMKSNAVVFIFSNGAHGIDQWNMNPNVYRELKDPIDQFNTVQKWNYTKIAETFGATAYNVQTHKDLEEVLKRIESSNSLSVIELTIHQKDVPQNARWRFQN